MRKFSIFSAFAVAVIAAMMFTSCKEKPTLTWNVGAQAKGEGTIVVSYPTGHFTAIGAAEVTATSANDTTVFAETFNLMNSGAPTVADVLANPAAYDKEVVEAAAEADKAVKIDVLEGTWSAAVQGYIKYDKIYVVIDEKWPSDTTKVAQ